MQFPRVAAVLLALPICFGAAGCFDVPIGDPTTSKIDKRLIGLWTIEGQDSPMLLVNAWDDHTYALTEIKSGEPGACYKAWLTEIGGKTFITLDQSPHHLKKPDRPYLLACIEVKDDVVIARALNAEVIKDARTPEALQKLIAAKLDDPKLFLKETNSYRRASPEQAAKLK